MTPGFTLLELMVTVCILTLLATVSGLAVRSLKPDRDQQVATALAEARAQAIRSGRPVAWSSDSVTVRFLPNGSSTGGDVAIGGRTWVVDPLTGAVHAAR